MAEFRVTVPWVRDIVAARRSSQALIRHTINVLPDAWLAKRLRTEPPLTRHARLGRILHKLEIEHRFAFLSISFFTIITH